MFVYIFKQGMIDCFRQDQASKLADNDRFKVYRSNKMTLHVENYVLSVTTVIKFRDAFIHFIWKTNVYQS